MTKRILYLSLSLLCLVCAYQLGADRARAEWDPTLSGVVVGGTSGYWYSASGEAWWPSFEGWVRQEPYDLPVSAADVKFLSNEGNQLFLITRDDIGWRLYDSVWTCIGPFPGSPVPLQSDSWGKIKDRYRD
jgi:hypothetical protein